MELFAQNWKEIPHLNSYQNRNERSIFSGGVKKFERREGKEKKSVWIFFPKTRIKKKKEFLFA